MTFSTDQVTALYDPYPEISCRHCRPAPLSDPTRLSLLRRTGLLDAPPDKVFERLTSLTTDLLEVPVALVSLVDDQRQFFPAQTGLPEPWASRRETPLSHSFCQHVVTQGRPLIIRNSQEDSRVCTNQAVPDLGVLAYAGYPIVVEGETLGSFCAIRGCEHDWSKLELRTVREFAETVSNELELRLELERKEESRLSLERSNRDLENFARIASHDLKEPLRGVTGCLNVALTLCPDLPEEVQELFHHAVTSAERMTTLVNSLYIFSRISAPASAALEEVDLNEVVEDVRADLRMVLQERGAKVTVEGSLGTVTGRRSQLRQLWQNLITNAVKFAKEDTPSQVVIERRDQSFSVRDNGIGIQEEHLEKVFGFLSRLHPPSRYPGAGVGLTLCRRVVEGHGGEIWAESEPGSGSTFHFTLPSTPAS